MKNVIDLDTEILEPQDRELGSKKMDRNPRFLRAVIWRNYQIRFIATVEFACIVSSIGDVAFNVS